MIATFSLPPPYGATRFMLRHEYIFKQVGKGSAFRPECQLKGAFLLPQLKEWMYFLKCNWQNLNEKKGILSKFHHK